MRHRLLHRRNAEWLERLNPLTDIRGRPGFVGVDAQVHRAPGPAADDRKPLHVVLAVDTNLDLELAKAIDPHFPAGEAQLQSRRRRDGAAVAHAWLRLMDV